MGKPAIRLGPRDVLPVRPPPKRAERPAAEAAPPGAGRRVRGDLLTLRDISEMTTLSISKLERMKAAGQLPAHLVLGARSHRWRRADVEQWLAERAAGKR